MKHVDIKPAEPIYIDILNVYDDLRRLRLLSVMTTMHISYVQKARLGIHRESLSK